MLTQFLKYSFHYKKYTFCFHQTFSKKKKKRTIKKKFQFRFKQNIFNFVFTKICVEEWNKKKTGFEKNIRFIFANILYTKKYLDLEKKITESEKKYSCCFWNNFVHEIIFGLKRIKYSDLEKNIRFIFAKIFLHEKNYKTFAFRKKFNLFSPKFIYKNKTKNIFGFGKNIRFTFARFL